MGKKKSTTNKREMNKEIDRTDLFEVLSNDTLRAVYIWAKMGWGKTKLVKRWIALEKQEVYWVDCAPDTRLADLEDRVAQAEHNRKAAVLVLDDLQRMTDPQWMAGLAQLIQKAPACCRFIIMGRILLPEALRPLMMRRELQVIGEAELSLDKKGVKAYLARDHILITDEEAAELRAVSGGWPLALNAMELEIKQNGGRPLRGSPYTHARRMIYDLIAGEVFLPLRPQLQQDLMLLGLYECFDTAMAGVLMDDEAPQAVLDEILHVGSFLTEVEPGSYRFTPFMYYFFKDRRQREKDSAVYVAACRRLGKAFEQAGNFPGALDAYYRFDLFEEGIGVLKAVLAGYPAADRYFELEPYLRATPEARLKTEPILCAAMAIIHYLSFDMEACRHWLTLAETMESDAASPENRAALSRVTAHLRLALPGARGLFLRTFLKDAACLAESPADYADLTATGNGPRVLAGTWDLCSLGSRIPDLEPVLAQPLADLLGRGAAGIMDLALGEGAYLQDELAASSMYQARAMAACESRGTRRTLFAAKVLLVKNLQARGKLEEARRLMLGFRDRAAEDDDPSLLQSIEIFRWSQSLLQGPDLQALEWFEDQGIDENLGFRATDVYGYLVKIRVMLCQGAFERALALIELVKAYAWDCGRICDGMEALVLQAVCLYKLHCREAACDAAREAVEKSRDYGFVRLFADEGGGVLPVLKALQPDYDGDDYFAQILACTQAFHESCPRYYIFEDESGRNLLTNAELVVMGQISTGRSNVEIAEFLSVSLATVKTHINRIYSKLGVKNRTQALIKAESLGIV
jgi:LuxR family maltose regulon positive regulatory protein